MNVGKEIAELKQVKVLELRESYEAVFGEPTRAGNKDWLWKRIAWRMQANAEGGLAEPPQSTSPAPASCWSPPTWRRCQV